MRVTLGFINQIFYQHLDENIYLNAVCIPCECPWHWVDAATWWRETGTPVRMVCGVAALQSAPGIVCERRASVVVRRPATTSVREQVLLTWWWSLFQ